MPDYSMLPGHMREGMQRYIEHGHPTGDFLRLVLSNDLMGALGKADDVNRHSLFAYGMFLYNEAPQGSFGSPEAYDAWRARGGLAGVNETPKEGS